MYGPELLEPLIDQIYNVMLDPSQWWIFLTQLAEALGGKLPTLYLHDTSTDAGAITVSVGYDPKTLRDYRDYFAKRNVWLLSGRRLLETGKVRTSDMMCSRRRLLSSEWYQEYCRPLRISQGIGATILKDASSTVNISVFADDSRRSFGLQEMRLLEALMPHLQRAVKVQFKIAEVASLHAELIEALDKVSVGVLLVERSGRVEYMNATAGRIIDSVDGIRIDSGGLAASLREETARLQRLIAEATETSNGRGGSAGGTVMISRPSGRRSLEVLVSPIRACDSAPWIKEPVAIVLVCDPEAMPIRSETLLRDLYHLSPAEARVAVATAKGGSLGDIAEALGVSKNTVKSQLRKVFRKTNTRGQTELVRLLLGGVPSQH